MKEDKKSFEQGQEWASPRGNVYHVIEVKNGQATLRLGGYGRVDRRKQDATENWILCGTKP